jgi:hypothetical protein
MKSAVGELRSDVSFLVLETGEFWSDNIVAVGELRPEYLSLHIYLLTMYL